VDAERAVLVVAEAVMLGSSGFEGFVKVNMTLTLESGCGRCSGASLLAGSILVETVYLF